MTEFYPLAKKDIEDEIINEDFSLLLGQGMTKWKEQGYLFPADALLLFRMNQMSIPQDLLQETMRLAAAACKEASQSKLREIAKAALILFATEPSKSAKEIMQETGARSVGTTDAPQEVTKVLSILHKINNKYCMLAFPDGVGNPFALADRQKEKPPHGNKGKKRTPHVFIGGKEYNFTNGKEYNSLEDFMQDIQGNTNE